MTSSTRCKPKPRYPGGFLVLGSAKGALQQGVVPKVDSFPAEVRSGSGRRTREVSLPVRRQIDPPDHDAVGKLWVQTLAGVGRG
jgi:hypothetical protein